jgi:hypothetical protein
MQISEYALSSTTDLGYTRISPPPHFLTPIVGGRDERTQVLPQKEIFDPLDGTCTQRSRMLCGGHCGLYQHHITAINDWEYLNPLRTPVIQSHTE